MAVQLGFFDKFLCKTHTAKADLNVTKNDTTGLTSPYIILSNHPSEADMYYIQSVVPELVGFVDTDNNGHAVSNTVFEFSGNVAQKSKFDFDYTKEINRAIKNRMPLCIFPEHSQTWDGVTMPVCEDVIDCVKSAGLPVVACKIEGAYNVKPRWAQYHRKGSVYISLKLILRPEELAFMTTNQIAKIIANEISVKDVSGSYEPTIRCKGKNLAEDLSEYLYVCPHCHQVGTLRSIGNLVYCTKCVYKVQLNNFGFFEQVNKPMAFSEIHDWAMWQNGYMLELLSSIRNDSYVIQDTGAGIYVLKGGRWERIGVGNAFVRRGTFVLRSEKLDRIWHFDCTKLQGVTVIGNDKCEFSYNDFCYRLVFFEKSVSVFKWATVLSYYSGSLFTELQLSDAYIPEARQSEPVQQPVVQHHPVEQPSVQHPQVQQQVAVHQSVQTRTVPHVPHKPEQVERVSRPAVPVSKPEAQSIQRSGKPIASGTKQPVNTPAKVEQKPIHTTSNPFAAEPVPVQQAARAEEQPKPTHTWKARRKSTEEYGVEPEIVSEDSDK